MMNASRDFKSNQCSMFNLLCALGKLERIDSWVVYVWKRIPILLQGNGVLRALLGFIERNCWIVLCFIVLCPTSKGRNLRKWNQMELGFCCWATAFMTSWLLRKDHGWCDPLRSKVLYCIIRINKIKGLVN